MKKTLLTLILITTSFLGISIAHAGVFNLPRYVPQGRFALGLEPEVTLTNGAGVGINARYTHGVSDLSNLAITLGTGSGPRQFRVGAAYTFDFFPDTDGQIGVGIAPQLLYVQLSNVAQMEATLIPYLHKTFQPGQNEFTPYLAMPVGWAFQSNGTYIGLWQIVMGTIFRISENFRSTLELGVRINNTETYFSGGIAYYY